MAKKRHPCIICGRKIGRETKFPSGSIYLCTDQDCRDALVFKINGNALPIAQFNLQAIIDHEVISEEIAKYFAKDFKTIRDLATEVEEHIWNGESLGKMFNEALVEAGQKLEKNFIAGLKDKELPLHTLNEFKSEEAKKLFECRLKGGSESFCRAHLIEI